MVTLLRRLLRSVGRSLKWAATLFGILLLITSLAAMIGISLIQVERPTTGPVVTEVTGLYPVRVDQVLRPNSIEEIARAVREHPGPISIGGGRYSMGGQTATRGTLQLDLRGFARVLAVDTVARTVTVQAGARWRDVQEAIDPAGLSVKVMQTYANFTVGGSLSVNAHGRYVGLGPLVLSVRSITLVLADGSVVVATPTTHPDLFYGAIGGYGALGVIVEATLDLAPNVRVRRVHRTMPIADYRHWFAENVRHDPTARFHNADIYPNAYETVNAVTYQETTDSVTIEDRLIPADRSYRLNRFVFWVITTWPGGEWIREHVVDPWLFRADQVTWRNYEASYDVAELEPASRARTTYVLQEYFIPADSFDRFVPRLREILQQHEVNVVNVSIRHALPDPGTTLAWAPREVFSFVLYYKQGTDDAAREAVGTWTRELIDAALSVGGTYYLPYQPLATQSQFEAAYPGAARLFALKARIDPTTKFRNTLWDAYYRGPGDRSPLRFDPRQVEALRARPGYRRDEGQTYLTHPEWFIVYSPDEYAAYLKDSLPTNFPYFRSIGEYWINYREANRLTEGRYPFNWGYQVMLAVIGTSYSAELTVKGLYENTLGRFSGWTAGHQPVAEDRLAYEVADDYARFIHVRPWYEYRFWPRAKAVWTELPWWGEHPFRIWERKSVLTMEYGVKAVYATLIERATHAAYGVAEDRMEFVAHGIPDSLVGGAGPIRLLERLDHDYALYSAPRYDEFRDAMRSLSRIPGVELAEIAGNDEIFLTGLAPAAWHYAGTDAAVPFALPLPTDARQKRVMLSVPVTRLLPLLRSLDAEGKVHVDHVYDY